MSGCCIETIMFCPYKNIFGEPEKGVHANRFLGLAVNDLIPTVIIGIVISYYFDLHPVRTFIYLALFVILIHRLFCVNTAVNTFIFGEV